MMSMDKLPNRHIYWTPEAKVDSISKTMTRNGFVYIPRMLHFNKNTYNDNKKPWKI